MVRLTLFGSPRIEYEGESFVLPFERRNQLLALLALRRSWVGRAELAAMFWPEQAGKLALANLRKILFRLQSLPWAGRLESQGGAVRFEAETDVFAFESALRENRIADALPLRGGELLAGFDDDSSEAWAGWLTFERDRLWVAWRGAVLNRLASGIDSAEGIALSARLLESDPLDEDALRAHMAALGRDGQGTRARQAYREFTARMAADLGLPPGPELKALHDSLGTAAPAAPVGSAGTPVPDDGFVGRTVELRRISELLAQDDCRLLCLVGPGGVGKSRLARRAMQALAPLHPDGAVFIPLEDVSSAGELGGRLARELGVSVTGKGDPLEQVREFLRDRQVLLVLDNFEQLAADAPILESLLQTAPRLKLIATSRVRLASPSEWLLPLEGLPCPEVEDQDHVESFDAARLFVKAAQRVEPALIPAAQAQWIVDICRQVEGLPLALELAAAWTRVLSCEAIAAELRQGTELLRAVDAAHPARHASVEVVFDHSWQLLGAIERDALARLSVFRGGFSAQAARAVAAASLPVLGALADKSLLRKDGTRIHLHSLVQQLAALRLGEGAARAAADEAHALYFHRHLAQLGRAVDDGDREALQWVDTELENCRIAWRWAGAHEAGNVLAKSAPTLVHFFDHRGRPEEGLALLRDTLESPIVVSSPKRVAQLLGFAAHLEYRLDRYAQAERAATTALAAARTASEHDTMLQCLKVLGSCCLRLGRHVDAKRFFQQALQLAPASTDPHNAADSLNSLALVEKWMGHYDEAQRLSIEALEQQRRLGDVAGEALSLNNLGSLHLEREDFESAALYLKPGLVLCDRHGLVGTRALILANLTGVAMKSNDHASAETYAARAIELAQATGNRYVASFMKMQFVRFALRRGALDEARSHLASALEIAIAIGRPSLLLEGLVCFSEILGAQDEPDCERMVLVFAANNDSMMVPERDAIRARLAQRPAAGTEPAWPGLQLGEFVHRIVVESAVAHAPLIALLRAGGQSPKS